MTTEQKARAYDEALKQIKECTPDENGFITIYPQEIFPKLQESEDERIRKGIKSILEHYKESGEIVCPYPFVSIEEALAWLEKQGEKLQGKSALEAIREEKVDNANKVVPKFKVGDWITNGYCLSRITFIDSRYWYSETGVLGDVASIDKKYHLWTIQDAKDGDVLVSKFKQPFIYNGNYNAYDVGAYCGIVNDGSMFIETNSVCQWTSNMETKPATKQQRDLLFKKMKEAGYEWDEDKKELKKIEQSELTEFEDAAEYMKRLSLANMLSERDRMNKEIIEGFEKQGEQKSAWSEEDECYMSECIGAIATKDGWSFEEKRKTKHWLKSLKKRIEDKI